MHPHGIAVDLKERSGRPTSSGHPCRCPHHPERESTQFTGRGRGTHGLTHRSSMGMGPGPIEAWRASESDVTGRAQRFRQGARSRCRRGPIEAVGPGPAHSDPNGSSFPPSAAASACMHRQCSPPALFLRPGHTQEGSSSSISLSLMLPCTDDRP
jgi:hypothetical protein